MASQSEELKVVISVVDRLTSELAKLTGTIDKLEQHVDKMNQELADGADDSKQSIIALNAALELVQKSLSITATAVKLPITSFLSLTEAVTDLVREYDAEAQAAVRLTSALTLQGSAVEETASSLQDYAAEIQKTTRFSDESVLGTEALFASFLKDEAAIKRATRAAVDFAAAFGEPLEASAQKVLAAIESGSIRIGRFTLSLSEATDPAQRFQEVLAGIEGKFGGVADKVALVGAGPLDQLANTFSDLRETLGKLITQTPEFQAFLDTAKQLAESLTAFAEDNSSDLIAEFGAIFEKSFRIAALAIEGLVAATSKLVEAVDKISRFFGVFDSEATDARQQIERLEEANASFSESLKNAQLDVEGVETGLTSWLRTQEEAQQDVEAFSKAIEENNKHIENLRERLAKLDNNPFEKMKKDAGELASEIAGLVEQIGPNFQKNLEIRRGETPEAADQRRREGIERGIAAVEGAGLTGDLAKFQEQAKALEEAARLQQEAAQHLDASALEIDASSQQSRALDQATADEFDEVTAGLDLSIAEWGVVLDEQHQVIGEWNLAAAAQGSAARDLSGSSIELDGSALQLGEAASALVGAADGLGGGLADLQGVANELDGAADAMQDAAAALQDVANGLLQGFQGEPQLASGAIVRRATRAVIGEAGPEAVIPLNEEGEAFARRAFGLGGGGFTFNVSAESLALSERGLSAVAATMDRRHHDMLLRRRRIRTGSL